MGRPEEIGMTALYLAADASFCTGIDIQVSGGSALNYADKNMRKTVTMPTKTWEKLLFKNCNWLATMSQSWFFKMCYNVINNIMYVD